MNIRLGWSDLAAIGPLVILLGGGLIQLLLESFAEKSAKRFAFPAVLITFLLAMAFLYSFPVTENPLLTAWLRFDRVSYFFTLFFLIIGLASAFLAEAFFERFTASRGEYFFLLLSATFGLVLIGDSADFLTLFLGLETLSIALYILSGYMKRWKMSHEAAIKYFLIGAIAAALLLYGIALIYGATGTTSFKNLLGAYHNLDSTQEYTLFLSGIALVTLGFAFKAAIVPFHFWAPDVYEGAPTPVTAFMAVGTKAGAFAAFVVVFLLALPNFNPVWNQVIGFLVYPTLVYANLVALRQAELKRFFAYSGISHAGFLLLPLAASTSESLSALLFYLVVYALATLGAFAVLAFLDERDKGVMISDLKGLFWRSPPLAVILIFCLLTLIGIPPTAGFFAKFFIFKVAFQAGYYGQVVVGLLMTILAAYYYLRIASVMLADKPKEMTPPQKLSPAILIGICSFAAILLLSLYPAPLLALISVVK